MTRLVAHGLGVTLPERWEGRVARRRPPGGAVAGAVGGAGDRQRAYSEPGERTFAVLHLASFPLPEHRDDFGGNFTPNMRSSDAFVALFEYGPDAALQPLFSSRGVPRVTAQMFSPNRLQQRRPGQVGCQLFFNASARAFCLYVVAGSRASLPRIITQVNGALAQLEVDAMP
jgi:hypothetical protein